MKGLFFITLLGLALAQVQEVTTANFESIFEGVDAALIISSPKSEDHAKIRERILELQNPERRLEFRLTIRFLDATLPSNYGVIQRFDIPLHEPMAFLLLQNLVDGREKTVVHKRPLSGKEELLGWATWSYLGYFETVSCEPIPLLLSSLTYNQRLLLYYANVPEEAVWVKVHQGMNVNASETHFVVKALADDECAKRYGTTDYPALILIRNQEDFYHLKLEDEEENLDVGQLREWVWALSVDQYLEVQETSLDYIHNQHRPFVLAFSYNSDDSAPVEALPASKYLHAFVDMNFENCIELARQLGVGHFPLPLLLVYEPQTNHKWISNSYSPRIQREGLLQLTQAYEAGTLAHYLKSEEEVLGKRKQGIMTKLTGKNHDQFLTEQLGDIFILYCDPEVEICRNIQKELEIANQAIPRTPSLFFGQLNPAYNELELIDFSSIPQLALYPRSDHSKKVLFADDSMDSEGLAKWMRTYSHLVRLAKKHERDEL